jgi:ketosteroid isomerase-like protein
MPTDTARNGSEDRLDENKALVRLWIDAINECDEGTLGNLLSADFLYRGMGRMPKEIAVQWNRKQFLTIVSGAKAQMRKPVKMTITRQLAEGNRVTLETKGYGEMKDGFPYANAYCLLFETDSGKIKSIRVYSCTRTLVVASEHGGEPML